MSIFEYDEELHKKTLLEEGYEKGLERGRSEGLERGRSEGMAESILSLLEKVGAVPDNVRQTILSVTDMELLKSLLRLAPKVNSLEEYTGLMTEILK